MADDLKLGIAIRFIRQYDAESDRPGASLTDRAFVLALADTREDVPFAIKVRDAVTWLKRQIH